MIRPISSSTPEAAGSPGASLPLRLKPWLRSAVVWSARPPLDRLYRALYGRVAELAVARLKRHRCVEAIYLCRGSASGEAFVPGVSDVDLAVVTRDDGPEKAAVEATCVALGRATLRIVDSYPKLVVSRAGLERRWRTTPAWQFRYGEGRASWRLVHGEDVLAALAPLPEDEWRAACLHETSRWWLYFAEILLATDRHRRDRVLRNATCYKAVAEIARLREMIETGAPGRSRAEALALVEPALAARLRALADSRFRADDPGVADLALRFLISSLVALAPRRALFGRRGERVELDDPAEERGFDEATRRHAELLAREARARHPARLVRSAFWPLDDVLAVIEPASVPEIAALVALSHLHRRERARRSAPLHVFLRFGPVLLPLIPTLPRDLHRGLPTPWTMPDVFLQLGEREVSWSSFAAWFLGEWRTNEQWEGAPAAKLRQLEAIRLAAERGTVVLPLTAAAIERATLLRHRVAEAGAATPIGTFPGDAP